VIFWGGFNTALEYTNTEQFCISCHEMEANVYEELTRTVHYSNRSGVRATCSGLPRAARMDPQDRPQDAGLEGGVGPYLRHHQHARKFLDTGCGWPSTNGRG
jgi:hypothetical protein